MKQIRSYRRRGSPDFPLAVYLDNISAAKAHPLPEYHPEIEIVWLIAGHAVLQLNGATKTFSEGDIFVIPGNTIHHYESFSPDAKWCSIIFGTDAITMHPTHFFQTAFTLPLSKGVLQLPPLLQPGHPAYEAVLTQINALLNCRIYSKDYKLHRFTALIALCIALAPYCTMQTEELAATETENEAVRLCQCYIHNNHTRKLTLEELSRVCYLQPTYLCTVFKAETGETIFEYITRFRVESAAVLLKKHTLPISKISEMVGFRSESLFYRKFKEVMGVTPKAYAKQNKNK